MQIPSDYHFMGCYGNRLLDRAVEGTQCIVLGDAPNAAVQYTDALSILPYAHLMVVNNAIRRVPDQVPQLVATLHGGKKDFIGTPRMPVEPMHDALLICEYNSGWEHARVDLIYHGYHTGGTSALFAVLSAIYLGYERILMAGCDIVDAAYASSGVLATWGRWAPLLCQRVDSMGGNTKRILEEARAKEESDGCTSTE
jgi:hypothetical protein